VASGAVVVTAALVLSACSAGAGDDGEGSDGAGDSSGGGGAEEVTLEFSLTGGTVPAQAAVLDEAISAFEDANEGVTINMTEVGWNDSFGQYQTRLSAGNPPDIALLAPSWVATFMENDAFASVDEYVDPSVLDNAYESGYDGMVGEDGTRYGVQWDASIWGMFYRTDLFEAAGLDPESPPATWDELREVSAALVESGVEAPLAFPFAGTNPDDFFLPMMWQAGAEVVNEEGEVVFDSSETLEAATFLKTLVDEGYVSQDIVGQDWEATMNSFIAGDAAIMYNGPWVVGSLQSNAPELDGSWATAQYPEGPGGKGTLGYPNGLVISALSDHKEIAGDFISFLFQEGDPSYFFEYMKVTGVFGFTKDFAETDDEFVTNPLNVPFLESVEFARNRPTVPWYEEFRQRAFTPGLQEIVLGSLTPEQFVEEATEAAEQLAGQ
jgi:ABC-type glycerol-3-phosphate transport system substrate-binding protein